MSKSTPGAHGGPADASGNRRIIAIRLRTYDDLFSHFDPRPYAERTLSDDFLTEIAKPRLDRSKTAPQLEFFMPSSERSPQDESVIRERLHRHFDERADALEAQRQHAHSHGTLLALIGTGMLLASALVRTYVHNDFAAACLTVALEPGGWYAVWYGFDELFYGAKTIATEQAFHRRMTDASIVFRDR